MRSGCSTVRERCNGERAPLRHVGLLTLDVWPRLGAANCGERLMILNTTHPIGWKARDFALHAIDGKTYSLAHRSNVCMFAGLKTARLQLTR
jgi:hypothetical protein